MSPQRGRSTSVCALLLLLMTLELPSSVFGQTRKARVEKGTQPTTQLSLWVPAYYYPNGPGLREWDRLIAAAKVVPIVYASDMLTLPTARARILMTVCHLTGMRR